jgi:hypothetical protein
MASEPIHEPGAGPESGPHFTLEPAAEEVQAWEQVDTGRYMPRRIRGSFKGRALG